MPWATGKRKKTGGHFVGPKRHQLRQPTPTFKDISVYCIGSQQWPPTFKQVSHLGIHFFIVGFFEKMMLKKCLKIHTHPPATRNRAASTTPIASLSGNTLLLNQCEITPKKWRIKTILLKQGAVMRAIQKVIFRQKCLPRCTMEDNHHVHVPTLIWSMFWFVFAVW